MRRSLPLAVAAMVFMTGLDGCVSLLPKTKPSQLYRFGQLTLANPDAGGAPASAKVGLVLGLVGFPRAATSDGILTVTGDRTAYIAGARWVAPARVLFQEALQREFQTRTGSVQPVEAGDVGPAGAVLRVDVSSFEVDYGAGQPVVSIALNARLSRADGAVLDQREFNVAHPAAANSVSAIVAAYDQATSEMLGDLAAWTEAEIAKAPPPAVSAPASPPAASAPPAAAATENSPPASAPVNTSSTSSTISTATAVRPQP